MTESHGQNVLHLSAKRDDAGSRLDVFIAAKVDHLTRSLAGKLIRQGYITVSGEFKKPNYRINRDDKVWIEEPPVECPSFTPEPMALDILFEDDAIIVLNKAANVVVHPAPGHNRGTLVNGLLYHCGQNLANTNTVYRPGIVHRLDKDTTGIMVVAKSNAALNHLALQFKARSIKKTYMALVHGVVQKNFGTISFPIGRHPVNRKRMSIHSRKSRPAVTHWEIATRFSGFTLLRITLETGRTHQIRTHLKAIGHAIVGDRVYTTRSDQKKKLTANLLGIQPIDRQLLHALRLEMLHPASGKPMTFTAKLPNDMVSVLKYLAND